MGKHKASNERKKTRRGKKAQAAVPTKEILRLPDGSRPTVKVTGWSLRGLPSQLEYAGNRFLKDWEVAFEAPLRCRGFEPGVDGSGAAHDGHGRSLDAQRRLAALSKEIGADDYKMLIIHVVKRIGPTQLNKAGGGKKDAITNNLKRILRRVAGFYSGKPVGPDPLLRAADKIIAAMEREDSAAANTMYRGLLARVA
jgi:hypothetical protein